MEEGRPSGTAMGAATLRAAHQLLDSPRVLEDPLALRLVGSETEATIRSHPQRFDAPELRALRASIAARSRFAEDSLAAAVARGVRQYVILGAGLDSFAYRSPLAESGLRVLEVDHPATQAWKRDRLREAGVEVPASLTFAPVDFEKETLADGLSRAGFAADVPSFFSWLGVTVYLTRSAVMDTLAYVARETASGSEIVFTFLNESDARDRASSIRDRARAHGEEWLTFFEPSELAASLRRMGFTDVEHLDAAGVNRRYFGDRADGLRMGDSGHFMRARV